MLINSINDLFTHDQTIILYPIELGYIEREEFNEFYDSFKEMI